MRIKIKIIRCVLAIVGAVLVSSCQPKPTESEPQSSVLLWPELKSQVTKSPAIETKIDAILARMSVEEKVGQIIQPEIKQVSPEDVRRYHLGSVLNGGGTTPDNNKYATLDDWVSLADSYWHASMDESDGNIGIPIMWGTDAVHGVGNVIGATLFPHNIGLGATHNPALIHDIGRVTARELAATGVDWDFSPTVAVARDDRWGRSYESYSEDPQLVFQYASKMVGGLQGKPSDSQFLDEEHVIATAKHFVGDGGTNQGIDRGDTLISESELRDIHAQGYISAIEAGVQVVMVSFSSWNGEHMHGHEYLLNKVLKERMGFDGIVIGDWSGHGFVSGCTTVNCPQAINAGLDVFMMPEPQWRELYRNTVKQVKSGVISTARLDDAVRRVLRVKMRAGLFERGSPSTRALAGKKTVLGAPEHRAVARKAVQQSLVMLKNQDSLLPLSPKLNVLVTGDGANNIGKQTGGWTISWQGTGNSNDDFPGATSIYQGIEQVVNAAGGEVSLSPNGSFDEKPDVAIVVYGEDPYAEMQGDRLNVVFEDDYESKAILQKLAEHNIPTVSLFITGRPLWVNPYINLSDAFVVAWLPGTEGAGIADVIFSRADNTINVTMQGKLPFSWPMHADQVVLNLGDKDYAPLFPVGFGLQYGEKDPLSDNLTEKGLEVAEISEVLELFKFRPQKPWQTVLKGSKNEKQIVMSSTASLPSIAIEAVDRNMQRDARRVVWGSGGVNAKGAVALISENRQDLSGYLKAKGALSMDVNVHEAPSEKVRLLIGCGSYCEAELDFTEILKKQAGQGWQTLVIDLACFPKSNTTFGLDPMEPAEYFKSVYEPFKIETEGRLDLSFAEVKLKKNAAESATLSCQ